MSQVRNSLIAIASICSLHLPSPVRALDIEYLPDRAAALAACDEHRYAGRRAESARCYTAVISESADPRLKAEAARALGDARAANGYFQQAIEQYPEDAAVRARWGELFAATHQANEAVKLFQESLEIDADHAPAKLGLARIAAQRFEDRARSWVGELLAANPRDLGARLLLARMELEEGALEEAEAALDEALATAERDNWPRLEIYALYAALDLLRGETQRDWVRLALEQNPRYGAIYATPAHFYVITRRYREAIEYLQRAVEIEPDLYAAHAELGINLLRENRVAEAQRHLEIAYRGDPYSAPVVNTLRLIDSFDNFVVSRESTGEVGAGMLLRLHREEDPVLRRYVADLVRRSVETFAARYDFAPEQPVVVELYPEHDDFAVRTSGLPGIGLLGVTFGYVVAMDSPSGRADNDFHWGTTLWHEMAHVFTLETTAHLVPRWFSEGISVFEEWSTGPLPGRQIPLHVIEMMQRNRLLPIADLDGGFIRPSYPNQVIVSYMQAGLACEFIAAQFGQQALVAMLERFRTGDSTVEALRFALELEPEAFDAAFRQYVSAEFGSLFAQLEQWKEEQGRVLAAAEDQDWESVLIAADTAIELYPDYVEGDSPYLAKARAYQALERTADAVGVLAEYHRRGGHDAGSLLRLSDWLAAADRRQESIRVLRDVLMVTPLNPEVHERLGERLLAEGQAEAAVEEFEILLAMNPHDRAAVHFRLARAYQQLEEAERAREHLLYALEIAPNYREAQQMLLEILR